MSCLYLRFIYRYSYFQVSLNPVNIFSQGADEEKAETARLVIYLLLLFGQNDMINTISVQLGNQIFVCKIIFYKLLQFSRKWNLLPEQ